MIKWIDINNIISPKKLHYIIAQSIKLFGPIKSVNLLNHLFEGKLLQLSEGDNINWTWAGNNIVQNISNISIYARGKDNAPKISLFAKNIHNWYNQQQLKKPLFNLYFFSCQLRLAYWCNNTVCNFIYILIALFFTYLHCFSHLYRDYLLFGGQKCHKFIEINIIIMDIYGTRD